MASSIKVLLDYYYDKNQAIHIHNRKIPARNKHRKSSTFYFFHIILREIEKREIKM